MAITNYEEMSITSPAFNTVREAFDVALQRLLKKMEKSKMDEGQIALNITVTNEDVFTDGDAELGDTDGPEKKPVLKYKITTTVPIKDTDDGKADTGMALVWDKDLGRYVLVYMQTNQTSMYDNPPAGGPQQTTMNPAQQIGQGERRTDRHPRFQAGRRRRRRITPIGQLLGIKRAAHPQTSNGLRMNGAGQPLLYHLSGGNASAAVSERSAFRIPADGNGK